jgi:DegV family protein with EDD domain
MTKKIRIITDSVSDIPAALLAKWNIDVIPCYVNYDGGSYADDGKELNRTEFYQSIASMKDFPSTAAPPPAIAEEVLARAIQGYDHLVSINVAESLSATINNIRIAAKSVDAKRITVLDSETVSMGIGWQALIAAEVAQETGDLDAVVRAAEAVKKNHKLYAAIYTMDFLRRSGRVNNVVAGIGSILQIKPIVTVLEGGKVEAVQRIRTFKKAEEKLAELLKEEGAIERLAIIHTQNEEGARRFIEEHKDLMPQNPIISEVGPTLGTHIGLNSLGFISVRKGWR